MINNLISNVERIKKASKDMEGTKMIKGTLRNMMKPEFKGNTLIIDLSRFGYENYFTECAYHFDKNVDKYSLSIWLNRNDLEDRMRLSSKKIDTQYISGNRENIVEHICRVVYQAATVADKNGEKYFDSLISILLAQIFFS